MKISRRNALKGSAVALFALVLPGCKFQDIFDRIKAYVPLGLSALSGILTVIDGAIGPPAMAIVTLIQAGFAQLVQSVNEYQAAPSTDKATIVGKIQTILTTIVDNFQNFLAAVQLNDTKLVNLVLGLAKVIMGTLVGFQQQLQPTAPAPAARRARMAGQTVSVEPLKLSTSDFKKQYNAIATQYGHPEIALR